MNKENIETLSEEQLHEKQELISKLSDDLLMTLKESELFENGLENRQIALDTLMGIGMFTASILDAAEKSIHTKGAMTEFYRDEILPSAFRLINELEEIDEEEKLKFS